MWDENSRNYKEEDFDIKVKLTVAFLDEDGKIDTDTFWVDVTHTTAYGAPDLSDPAFHRELAETHIVEFEAEIKKLYPDGVVRWRVLTTETEGGII